MRETAARLDSLRSILGDAGSVLIAFSGGVDSTFLCAVAREVLGDRATALTARSPAVPARELHEAERMADLIGIAHRVVESHELSDPRYARNPRDRCFHCKSELFGLCRAVADHLGIAVVADGFNADDIGDFRPGHEAGRAAGVRSPLVEAGLGKDAIRELSRDVYGLPTWDKPATPCLASRFPYGTAITAERLAAVEAVEEAVRSAGPRTVRARFHGDLVRIELGAGESGFLDGDGRAGIVAAARAAGFAYVTLDLEPFRSGRMNES